MLKNKTIFKTLEYFLLEAVYWITAKIFKLKQFLTLILILFILHPYICIFI